MRPQSQAELMLRTSGTPPSLRVDAGLNAALVSLLNNAADASPDAVAVEAEWDAAALRVSVLDRGPGLDPSERDAVLRPFVRGDQARVAGSGLGLSIVQRIARLHGGDLTLLPRPGGGLEARLRLRVLPPRG